MTSSSNKGSPAWLRGAERARAQAIALLKRIGPNAEALSDEDRKAMLRDLTADLQHLVEEIDKHLAEVDPAPPVLTPSAATSPTATR